MHSPIVTHPAQPPVFEGQGPHLSHCGLPRVPGEAKVKLRVWRGRGAEGHKGTVMGRSILWVQRGVPPQRSLEKGIQVQEEKKVEGPRAGGD